MLFEAILITVLMMQTFMMAIFLFTYLQEQKIKQRIVQDMVGSAVQTAFQYIETKLDPSIITIVKTVFSDMQSSIVNLPQEPLTEYR